MKSRKISITLSDKQEIRQALTPFFVPMVVVPYFTFWGRCAKIPNLGHYFLKQ